MTLDLAKMLDVTHATKLLYLYLLSRGRSELSESVLATRLGLSAYAVEQAKRYLKDEHLLTDHKTYKGATSDLEALPSPFFEDWPRGKRELPKPVRTLSLPARLVYLYLAGVDATQTLADIQKALDVPYMTVYLSVVPLKPYLDIVGQKPMHLKLVA